MSNSVDIFTWNSMSKNETIEALKRTLASIQIEKDKLVQSLWNLEFREHNCQEKLKRYGAYRNEEEHEEN